MRQQKRDILSHFPDFLTVSSYRARHALLVIPFSRSAGFAIDALVQVFRAAIEPTLQLDGRATICYGDLDNASGASVNGDLPASLDGFHWLSASRDGSNHYASIMKRADIDCILGLDLPATSRMYAPFRAAGVRTIVSYLGAPSSSINSGLKLWLKQREVALHTEGPDHHVFETESMRLTGVRGRGIPLTSTSVVPLGVDTQRFQPDPSDAFYAHDTIGIPRDRKIVFYSGHFEERKGVAVIMRAAIRVAEQHGRRDIHFLLLGNRGDEADRFRAQIAGTRAEEFVTFGGYRTDLERLHRSCIAGVLASTGWDSMTMSAVEMQSSGVPLLVSRLQGLPETIEERITGRTFTPGDDSELSEQLCALIDNEPARREMALMARTRAVQLFSREHQVSSLSGILDQTLRRTAVSRR